MTEQSKRDFWKLSDALPEGVHWGDPLTIDIAAALFAAYPPEQNKNPPAEAAECRKQVLQEAAETFADQITFSDATTDEEAIVYTTLTKVVVKLRRMAEPTEGEKL